uniref:Uncharacterized protein n=1 Tax=Anopheles culicifacies TaxID=139723 RepID=A0A182M9I1_9DIPT
MAIIVFIPTFGQKQQQHQQQAQFAWRIVLIGPARERVLLYSLPLRVFGQVSLRFHLCLLVRVRVVVVAGLLLLLQFLVVLRGALPPVMVAIDSKFRRTAAATQIVDVFSS